MAKKKKKYYAVAQGRNKGIYEEWYGEKGAKDQIDGFSGALYKGFPLRKDAVEWLRQCQPQNKTPEPALSDRKTHTSGQKKRVVIYTDGGCIKNPGPGGYGVVLMYNDNRKELSGGFRQTTNNRMELTACIMGLKALKHRCFGIIYSDSKYVVDGIKKGWARRWRANGWMRNKTDPAENADLWKQLLELSDRHKVDFKWVKGHAGNIENERCDHLAKQAAFNKNLPHDTAYEKGTTKFRRD